MDVYCLACKRRENATSRIKLYQFPNTKDTLVERRLEKWLEALNLPANFKINLAKHKICSRHFVFQRPSRAEDFQNVDWVPTLNLEVKGAKQKTPFRPKDSVECFAAGCDHNKREKTCRFYTFPKNDMLKRRWQRFVNLAGTQKITRHSLLCECHFPKGDVRMLPSVPIGVIQKTSKDDRLNSLRTRQVTRDINPRKKRLKQMTGFASLRDHSGYCRPLTELKEIDKTNKEMHKIDELHQMDNETSSLDNEIHQTVRVSSKISEMKSEAVQTNDFVQTSISTQTSSSHFNDTRSQGIMTECYQGFLTYDCLSKDPQMFRFFAGLALSEFDVLHKIVDADENHIGRMMRRSQFRFRLRYQTLPWSTSKDALLLVLIKIRRGYSYREMSILCMVHSFSLKELIRKWSYFLYRQLIGRPVEVDFKDCKEADVIEDVLVALEKVIYNSS